MRKCARRRPACAPERERWHPAGLARPAAGAGRPRGCVCAVGRGRSGPPRHQALYHVASAVMLAWEGVRIHQRRGDARRLLLSRLVLDHRLGRSDAFSREAGRRGGDRRGAARRRPGAVWRRWRRFLVEVELGGETVQVGVAGAGRAQCNIRERHAMISGPQSPPQGSCVEERDRRRQSFRPGRL